MRYKKCSPQITAGLAFGALVLAVAAPATAQTTAGEPASTLSGYVASASGSVFSLAPYFPGLLPTGDVPAEVTVGLTNANVKSGGAALAQAAAVWPGSAAANLGPLLGTGLRQPAVGALIPPYPAAVQATERDGEVVRGTEPGPLLRAASTATASDAMAQVAGGGVPGVLAIASSSSTSRTVARASEVVSESVVTLGGISILDDLLTVDLLRSEARTTSDGVESTSTGSIDVVGAKVSGVTVEIAADGVRATGLPPEADEVPGATAPFPGEDPTEAVNAALEAAGVEVSLTHPVGTSKGATADRSGAALRIRVANPAASLNPQLTGSRFDLYLGPTAAGAAASPGFDAGGGPDAGGVVDVPGADLPPPFTSGGTDTGGFGGLADVADVLTPDPGPADVGAAVPGAGPVPGIGGLAAEPASSGVASFGGVSLGLVLGVLVVAALAARWLRRALTNVLSMEEA